MNLSSSKTEKKEKIVKVIRDKVNYSNEKKEKPYSFHKDFSFSDCQLPPLIEIPHELRNTYFQSVVDDDMKSDLENAQAINCLPQSVKLFPVQVSKDGNCLLHAASVAVWGVEDSRQTLRDMMLMTVKINNNFKRRWWSQLKREMEHLEFIHSESYKELKAYEWDDVIRSISNLGSASLSAAVPNRFLEAIHVYLLANIFRRPIIVITSGPIKSLTGQNIQEDQIGGLYLPLEWNPEECCKTPIILGFSLNHFCPLLSENMFHPSTLNEKPMFPLFNHQLIPYGVRFLKDEEETRVSFLIQTYLQVREIMINDFYFSITAAPFAYLFFNSLDPESNPLVEHLQILERRQKEAEFLKASKGLLYSNLEVSQQRSHPFSDIEASSQTELVPVEKLKISMPEHQKRTHFNEMTSGAFEKEKWGFESSTISTNPLELGIGKVPGLIPTAPPMSINLLSAEIPPTSMMNDRCLNGCGYRCSQTTFPYCHECYKANTAANTSLQQSAPPNAAAKESSSKADAKSEQTLRFSDNLMLSMNMNSPELSSMSMSPVGSNSTPSSAILFRTKSQENEEMYAWKHEIYHQPESVVQIMTHRNCLNFDRCGGLKMLDHNYCHSCEKNSSSVQTGSNEILTSAHLQQTGNQTAPSVGKYPVRTANQIPQFTEKESVEAFSESFSEMDIKNMVGDVEVSEEPSCKVKCASPYCNTFISSSEKLCKSCLDVLQKNFEKEQKNLQNKEDVFRRVIEGQNEKEILLREKYITKKNVVPSVKDPAFIYREDSRIDQYPYRNTRKVHHLQTSQREPMLSTQRGRKGSHCIETSCPNYGDPNMDNKCSSCYFKSQQIVNSSPASAAPEQTGTHAITLEQYPTASKSPTPILKYHTSSVVHSYSAGAPPAGGWLTQTTVPADTISSIVSMASSDENSCEKSAIVTSKTGHRSEEVSHLLPAELYSLSQETNQNYKKVIEVIESGLSTSKAPCVTRTCGNYGNSNCEGYCNACYRVLKRQRVLEREAKYGVDVPDSEVTNVEKT